jgi:hypothetical protein
MNDEQLFEIPNDAEHYHQCVYYKIGTHNLLYAWLCGQWVRKSYDPKNDLRDIEQICYWVKRQWL